MYQMRYNNIMEIEIYETASGKRPFDIWLDKIKDKQTIGKILVRLDRLEFGNIGDYKLLKDGIYELKIHHGAGIRIYYSKIKNKVFLLLYGGVKGSQVKDIKKAKEFLQDYKNRGVKYGKK